MSNMTSVKSALEAEIRHAREGIVFYSSRIEALDKMLKQLDQLDGAPGKPAELSKAVGGKRRYTRKVDALLAQGTTESVGKSGSAAKTKLPATTAKFWLGLLSETPISNQEIIKSAIAALKIKPNPAELKKLKQRLANAITLMTKDGSMISDGTGRARRFSVKT
jgi:hypothetical protein